MTTIRIEHRALPLTFNVAGKASQWTIASELRTWRTAMGWQARASKVKRLNPPVTVTVHHYRKNRSAMPDVGAPIFAAKAGIDALVDVGILPGDGPEIVTQLTYLAPEVAGYHGLALEISEIEEVA